MGHWCRIVDLVWVATHNNKDDERHPDKLQCFDETEPPTKCTRGLVFLSVLRLSWSYTQIK